MKGFVLFLFLGFSSVCTAQFFEKVAWNTGYTYLGRNSVSLGAEYNFPINKNDWHGFSSGISGRYFKGENNKHYLIPELGISYRYFGYLTRINFSTEHFNPNIGINLLNIIWLYTGYSFTFDKTSTNLNGMVFGINFLIGKDEFYDSLKIGL